MELSHKLCIQRLDPSGDDPTLRNVSDALRVTDDQALKVLHITKKFQTRLSLSGCHKLTRALFDHIGDCELLRFLDLSLTKISSVHSLHTCTHLLSVNLRYTLVQDLRPLSHLLKMHTLDLGCTKIHSVEPLKDLANLKTLYVDDTAVSDVSAVLPPNCPALEYLNVGFTEVKPSLRPAIQKLMSKHKSRSYLFFQAVIDKQPEKIKQLISEGFNVNSRTHPNFETTSARPFYDGSCRQSTRFFKCAHDEVALRPTALHLACFIGDEPTVTQLLELGANSKLKCWFGKVTPAFNLDGIVDIEATPFDVVRLARAEGITKRLEKMVELNVLDWEQQCRMREHRLKCRLEGLDPEEEKEVEIGFD